MEYMNRTDEQYFQQPPIIYIWQDRLLYLGKLSSDSRLYSGNVCLFGVSLHSTVKIHERDSVTECSSFFILPNTHHKIAYDKSDIIAWMLIEPAHSDCQKIKEKMRQQSDHCYTDIEGFDDVKKMLSTIYKQQPVSSIAHQYLVNVLNFNEKSQYANDIKDMRILKIMQKINQEIARNIPSSELANFVGLSNGRLQQLFKQQAQMSIGQYRIWRRLKYAFELSPNSSNFSELAETSGFTDAAHFSRAFHTAFGKTASSMLGPANNLSFIQ